MRRILILPIAAMMDKRIHEAIREKQESLEAVIVRPPRTETLTLQAFPEPDIQCFMEPKPQTWQEKVAPAALLRKSRRSR